MNLLRASALRQLHLWSVCALDAGSQRARMALFQAYIRRTANEAAMLSARQAIERGDRARTLDVLARIARDELPAEVGRT